MGLEKSGGGQTIWCPPTWGGYVPCPHRLTPMAVKSWAISALNYKSTNQGQRFLNGGMLLYWTPLFRTVGYSKLHWLPIFCAQNLSNILQLQFVIAERQLDKTVSVFMLESNKWPLLPKRLEGKARVDENFNVSFNDKISGKQQDTVSQEGARILVGQKRALFNRATLGQQIFRQLICYTKHLAWTPLCSL